MSGVAERAIELIAKKGVMRSYEIEAALKVDNVAAFLNPRVQAGQLLACKVERPGHRPCNEYRLSMAAGGKQIILVPGRPHREPDPVRARLKEWAQPAGADALARGADLGRKQDAEPRVAGNGAAGGGLAQPPAPVAPRGKTASPATSAPTPLSPRIGAIEKGVPLPHSKRGNGELRVQISRLELGDSFVTSYSDSACYNMARKLGKKVISRPEGDAGDIRVWRTE